MWDSAGGSEIPSADRYGQHAENRSLSGQGRVGIVGGSANSVADPPFLEEDGKQNEDSPRADGPDSDVGTTRESAEENNDSNQLDLSTNHCRAGGERLGACEQNSRHRRSAAPQFSLPC